jgi:hypothetical protein
MPVAIAVELKTAKGTVRAEQKAMAEQKMTIICRSVIQVIETVLEYEKLYGESVQCARLERFIASNEVSCKL